MVITLVVIVLVVLILQYFSENKHVHGHQILQVPNASKIGVDMLMERVPVVIYERTTHAIPVSCILMFPWCSRVTAPAQIRFVCTSSICVVACESDVSLRCARFPTSEYYVDFLIKGGKTAVILPKGFSFVATHPVTVQERFSTLNFLVCMFNNDARRALIEKESSNERTVKKQNVRFDLGEVLQDDQEGNRR